VQLAQAEAAATATSAAAALLQESGLHADDSEAPGITEPLCFGASSVASSASPPPLAHRRLAFPGDGVHPIYPAEQRCHNYDSGCASSVPLDDFAHDRGTRVRRSSAHTSGGSVADADETDASMDSDADSTEEEQ
jgi:hypothetical protein